MKWVIDEQFEAILDFEFKYKSNFISLMEVKIRRTNVERVKNKLHFLGSFYVEGTNNGEKLALFWRHVNTITDLVSCLGL